MPVDRRRRDAATLYATQAYLSNITLDTLWTEAHAGLNLNFFTKHRATTVIYRLTVQTLPSGLRDSIHAA